MVALRARVEALAVTPPPTEPGVRTGHVAERDAFQATEPAADHYGPQALHTTHTDRRYGRYREHPQVRVLRRHRTVPPTVVEIEEGEGPLTLR